MTAHRNVGTHAEDVNGVLVNPGEEVDLDKDQLALDNIKQLVEDGVFIPIPAQKAEKETK